MKKYVRILFVLSVLFGLRESWGVTISLQLAEENASFQSPVLVLPRKTANLTRPSLQWLEEGKNFFKKDVTRFMPRACHQLSQMMVAAI